MQTTMNISLPNGVYMPRLIQGIPLINNYAKHGTKVFYDIIRTSLDNGIRAFDTSHDYGMSETLLGKTIKQLTNKSKYKREDLFITTKIGNQQQYEGNIEGAVNQALKTIGVEQIDLMLLHWPTPDVFVENWKKLIKVYHSGKVRAIGIANVLERHLALLKRDEEIDILPHVVQIEYHPFRTVPSLIEYCKNEHIAIQAYTSLLQMIPMVTENETLIEIAKKYRKTIPQIILRWDIQKDINPIFRTYNPKHLLETINIFDFNISNEDMIKIDMLDIDYKYHPESMNCPGY